MKILLAILFLTIPLNSALAEAKINEKNLNEIEASNDETLVNYNISPSLMFTEEQSDEIHRVSDFMRTTTSLEARAKIVTGDDGKEALVTSQEMSEKSYIYLGSIIYLSPKNWVVWVNNSKISSDSNKRNRDIYVESISRGKIKLLWRLSISKWKILMGHEGDEDLPKLNAQNRVEIRFSLKPNQTFILSSNKIVEGRATPSIVKKGDEKFGSQ